MLDEISSKQLSEWMALESIEGPIGERGAWHRMAHVASILANAHRDQKKRPQPFRLDEFLPWVERPAMTPRAFRAQFGNVQIKKKR